MTPQIEHLLKVIDARINGITAGHSPAGLYEPVSYCLLLGGKRMRPLMTLLGCSMFGGDTDKAMSAALGMELFHNFTLMHDDIMDNAPIRRGKPSVYKKWNINTAILSGDVMFGLACKYMVEVPDACLRKVLNLFNQTVLEVCEGQQYDMDFESSEQVSEAEYLEMIRLKTAVLPAACLKTGAMIAGASQEDASRLYRFGEYVGLAFQLKDDCLDVFGSEAVFGKKSGGDIIANKKTWLYIKARELANASQKQILHKAYSTVAADPEEKIRTVKGIFETLGIHEKALEKMEAYYQQAFEALDQIDISPDKKSDLVALVKGLFNRAS